MNEQETQLKTQHNFGDFLYWNLVVSVPFITACIAIARESILWLICYIITCILLVMVIYKFYCTHCPHYIQSPKNTKCMFFWGIPKFFKEKSGPLSLLKNPWPWLHLCYRIASALLFALTAGFVGYLFSLCYGFVHNVEKI